MGSDVYTPGQVSPQAIAAIKRLRADDYSYRQIAAYLDRKGIKPPKAKSWSAMTVRNVSTRTQ